MASIEKGSLRATADLPPSFAREGGGGGNTSEASVIQVRACVIEELSPCNLQSIVPPYNAVDLHGAGGEHVRAAL